VLRVVVGHFEKGVVVKGLDFVFGVEQALHAGFVWEFKGDGLAGWGLVGKGALQGLAGDEEEVWVLRIEKNIEISIVYRYGSCSSNRWRLFTNDWCRTIRPCYPCCCPCCAILMMLLLILQRNGNELILTIHLPIDIPRRPLLLLQGHLYHRHHLLLSQPIHIQSVNSIPRYCFLIVLPYVTLFDPSLKRFIVVEIGLFGCWEAAANQREHFAASGALGIFLQEGLQLGVGD
jgi:hypothetical protein